MKKKLINVLLLCCLVAIPSLFNSCGVGRFESVGNEAGSFSSSGGGGTLSAAAKCESTRQRAFANTYHRFIKTNCATCHAALQAPFIAAVNVGTAYNAFLGKSEDQIYEYATAGGANVHQAGLTGPQLKPAADAIRPTWMAAQSAYDGCILAAGSTGGTATIPVPSKFTVAKPFTIVPGTPVTMTWNTATEMMSAADSYLGGTVSMIVSVTDLGSGQGLYEFRNPRFVNANPTSPAYIKGIAVKVNGKLIPGGSTFYTLERYVPNIANNNSRQLTQNAGGAIALPELLNIPMSIQLGFTQLAEAAMTFDPPVFTTLATNGGIFAARCNGCHGNQGGLNLTVYANVVGSVAASGLTIVSKWSLDNSYIWDQIDGNLMPTAGPLSQPEKDRVRDWILDGAPNTAADVRR